MDSLKQFIVGVCQQIECLCTERGRNCFVQSKHWGHPCKATIVFFRFFSVSPCTPLLYSFSFFLARARALFLSFHFSPIPLHCDYPRVSSPLGAYGPEIEPPRVLCFSTPHRYVSLVETRFSRLIRSHIFRVQFFKHQLLPCTYCPNGR